LRRGQKFLGICHSSSSKNFRFDPEDHRPDRFSKSLKKRVRGTAPLRCHTNMLFHFCQMFLMSRVRVFFNQLGPFHWGNVFQNKHRHGAPPVIALEHVVGSNLVLFMIKPRTYLWSSFPIAGRDPCNPKPKCAHDTQCRAERKSTPDFHKGTTEDVA
jgi:hypothetical protein